MQKSVWDDIDRPKYPSLTTDLEVDVVIVGAGITGLTTAYLLKRAGLSVAVLEKGRIGAGDTYCTSAHLSYVTDTSLPELVSRFGRDHAQAVWHAGDASLMQIDEIIARERIDCDFRRVPGYWHGALTKNQSTDRQKMEDAAQLADELGFSSTFVDSAPIVNRPGVRFADQAIFHPLKYLTALAKSIDGDSCYLFEKTEVRDWDHSLTVRAGRNRVRCEYLVLATHKPIVSHNQYLSSNLFQTRLNAYNSYVVAGHAEADCESALWWDTSKPYYYLRTTPAKNGVDVVFGGADHKTGQQDSTSNCFQVLESQLADIMPEVRVTHRWSGQVIETTDGLPYIGEMGSGMYIATGFAGNGLTFGTLSAMMIRDAIKGAANPWRELFSPGRTSLTGTWNYFKENLSYPYYMVRDRLTRSEDRTPASLTAGQGALLKHNGEVVAAYCDKKGQLTMLSPVCPHMGCFVHWNDAEQTWDCPCHGSRFKATGAVHAGPARSPLAPHQEAAELEKAMPRN